MCDATPYSFPRTNLDPYTVNFHTDDPPKEIVAQSIRSILMTVSAFHYELNEYTLTVYVERAGLGFIKFVGLRSELTGAQSDQFLLTSDSPYRLGAVVAELRGTFARSFRFQKVLKEIRVPDNYSGEAFYYAVGMYRLHHKHLAAQAPLPPNDFKFFLVPKLLPLYRFYAVPGSLI